MKFLDRIFGRPQVFPVPEAPVTDSAREIELAMYAIAPTAAVEFYALLQANRLITDPVAAEKVLDVFVRELKLRGNPDSSDIDLQGSFHLPSNSASHQDY